MAAYENHGKKKIILQIPEMGFSGKKPLEKFLS